MMGIKYCALKILFNCNTTPKKYNPTRTLAITKPTMSGNVSTPRRTRVRVTAVSEAIITMMSTQRQLIQGLFHSNR